MMNQIGRWCTQAKQAIWNVVIGKKSILDNPIGLKASGYLWLTHGKQIHIFLLRNLNWKFAMVFKIQIRDVLSDLQLVW